MSTEEKREQTPAWRGVKERQTRISEWMSANRGGIAVVTDWRAVNR